MLKLAEEADPLDDRAKVLLDWAYKDDFGKDRVLYVKADATCLRGRVKSDPVFKSQALETWKQISPTYRADFPATETPELSGCVLKNKSN